MDHSNPTTAAMPIYIPMGKPFQVAFGPGHTTQRDLDRRGEIRTVLVGRDEKGRRMIEVASYLEYLARQKAREQRGEIGPSAKPSPQLARVHEVRRANAAAAREAKAAASSPAPAIAERSTAQQRRAGVTKRPPQSSGGGRRT
jgi:hypothetical protein